MEVEQGAQGVPAVVQKGRRLDEPARDTGPDIPAGELGLEMGILFPFEALGGWDVRPRVTRWLVKPATFMNDSGHALRALLDFHQAAVSDLIVAYDDLTIDTGLVKVSVSGSAGGHNGVASLLAHVGDGFIRYRLGINTPRPAEMDLKDFVLGKFSPEQTQIIDQKLNTFVDGLRLLINRGPAEAMNQLNRRDHHDPDQA